MRCGDVDRAISGLRLRDGEAGGRVVPLGPEARAMQADLPREGGNPWAITGRLPGTHRTNLQRLWRRIRDLADLKDVRIHDLSHSCAA